MRKETVQIRSAREVIGEVDVEIFDSIKEAREFFGRDVLLSKINMYHRERLINSARQGLIRHPNQRSKHPSSTYRPL